MPHLVWVFRGLAPTQGRLRRIRKPPSQWSRPSGEPDTLSRRTSAFGGFSGFTPSHPGIVPASAPSRLSGRWHTPKASTAKTSKPESTKKMVTVRDLLASIEGLPFDRSVCGWHEGHSDGSGGFDPGLIPSSHQLYHVTPYETTLFFSFSALIAKPEAIPLYYPARVRGS